MCRLSEANAQVDAGQKEGQAGLSRQAKAYLYYLTTTSTSFSTSTSTTTVTTGKSIVHLYMYAIFLIVNCIHHILEKS
jgi:hypothetical protein